MPITGTHRKCLYSHRKTNDSPEQLHLDVTNILNCEVECVPFLAWTIREFRELGDHL